MKSLTSLFNLASAVIMGHAHTNVKAHETTAVHFALINQSSNTYPFAPWTCHSSRCGRPSRFRWTPWLQTRSVGCSWEWSTSRPWDRECPLVSAYIYCHATTAAAPPPHPPSLSWHGRCSSLSHCLSACWCGHLKTVSNVGRWPHDLEDTLINNWRVAPLWIW